MLTSIISGGQTGVDIAALRAAKRAGLRTGGMLPKGCRTLDGSRPEYKRDYGMLEHLSSAYPPRTAWNVRNSEGTLRIASDFESTGEKCTWNAIVRYRKPYFDVKVEVEEEHEYLLWNSDVHRPEMAARWILDRRIAILNVAGNSERTTPGIETFADTFVTNMIFWVRLLEAAPIEAEPT